MKTQVFKGLKELDSDFSDGLSESTTLKIILEKIKEDLKQYDVFKGKPTIISKHLVKNINGYDCFVTINNRSETYENMEYNMFVSKNMIFEYIINELKEDIRAAKSSSGYYGGYQI